MSISYQDESSQFQSFANSPNPKNRGACSGAEPIMDNISPVKHHPEDLDIVQEES